MIFIAKMTPSGRFATGNGNGHADIAFLERMLIGIALEQNIDLLNKRNTKMLRDMVVPGILNSGPGAPRGPVSALRNCLGLA